MNFFINYTKSQKKAELISDTGAVMSYNNIVVKENGINERVYIVDATDEQLEYASLPLAITIIMTSYERPTKIDQRAN